MLKKFKKIEIRFKNGFNSMNVDVGQQMGPVSSERMLKTLCVALVLLSSVVQSLPQSSQRHSRSDVRDRGAYGAASYRSLGIQPAATDNGNFHPIFFIHSTISEFKINLKKK